MRLRLLVAALLSAVPALAQVRAVAPAAEAGGFAAGSAASARVLPLSYALVLNSPAPPLSAGSAFLGDRAAQQWLAQNRPGQFPSLVRNALSLRDWQQVLTAYDDPRQLREAVLSRPDSAVANDPALLLGMVDRAPALAANRRLYEETVLDWSVFSEETRAALAAAGAPEKVWAALPLPQRYEAFRRVFQQLAGRMITAQPGDPAYAAQYEKALRRVGAVMTDEELAGHAEALERMKSAAARTAEALTGAAAAETAAPEPAYDLSPAETRALLARLGPAILKDVRGTPSGDALLAEVSGGELSLTIAETSRDAALATYREESATIVLGDKQLAALLAALGKTPRDLLTDDEALADAAVLYSHLFVHEATHHRQSQWASRLPKDARPLAYSQTSEIEANNAQAKYLREKRAADPDFAAREERLRGVWGMVAAVMRQPEGLASDPSAMSSWLTTGYRHVPTLARSGARLIGYGLQAQARDAARADRIDAELGRRSRLPVDRRLELGQDTHKLRRLRDSLRGRAREMVAAVADMTERYRAALENLK